MADNEVDMFMPLRRRVEFNPYAPTVRVLGPGSACGQNSPENAAPMETTSASGRRTTNSIVCSFVLPAFCPLLPPLRSARVTAALAVTGSNRCR